MARMNAKTLEADYGIKVTAEFVPWSKSRNEKPKPKNSELNLNWKVTVWHKDREVMTTDYMAGQAHCPSYKANVRWTREYEAKIKFECENGKPAEDRPMSYITSVTAKRGANPIMPDAADVLYCLLSDAGAIDYATFEDWAGNYGYEPDSRSAESIYRACLETGLKLRAALGDSTMTKLQEAFQDF